VTQNARFALTKRARLSVPSAISAFCTTLLEVDMTDMTLGQIDEWTAEKRHHVMCKDESKVDAGADRDRIEKPRRLLRGSKPR
jgi:hypothetical protein